MNAIDDAALIEECARRPSRCCMKTSVPMASSQRGRRTRPWRAAHAGGTGRPPAANGQIPKFVEPEAQRGDFWYLGCIDATLWWLIAIKLVDQSGGGRLEHRLQARIRRALAWLGCREHPLIHLLQQNEASDWADIMPRSGFVLYTNAPWLYVKKLYKLPSAGATRQHANWLFLPGSREWRSYMDRHRQNLPQRYHNGGLWPMIGGFWVLALAGAGAGQCRRQLAFYRMVRWRLRHCGRHGRAELERGVVSAGQRGTRARA